MSCRRPWRRSTSRCGTATAACAASPSRRCSAREQGYGCVKVKVGLPDDAERVAAVRAAAGAEMELRVDANGAWSVPRAQAAIAELSSQRLELVGEPVDGVAGSRDR